MDLHIAPYDMIPPALMPPLRVRAGQAFYNIANLDEALAFARANPYPKGDHEGLIRRLQSADEPDEIIEAGNAFRWWAESNGILVERGLPG
jgi:hypothetical protein